MLRRDPYEADSHASSWFCNEAARAALERRGIIVGLGSACNTDAAQGGQSSHVLEAIGVQGELRPGTLRLSFSDETTPAEATRLQHLLLEVIADPAQLRRLD